MLGIFIKKSFKLVYLLTILSLVFAIVLVLNQPNEIIKIFNESYIIDQLSIFMKILTLLFCFFVLLFFVFVLLLTQQMPFNSDSHFWYFGIEFLDLHLAVQGGVKKVVWSWQAGGEEIMILAGLD